MDLRKLEISTLNKHVDLLIQRSNSNRIWIFICFLSSSFHPQNFGTGERKIVLCATEILNSMELSIDVVQNL